MGEFFDSTGGDCIIEPEWGRLRMDYVIANSVFCGMDSIMFTHNDPYIHILPNSSIITVELFGRLSRVC
jgi:hypothetical protein